MRWLALCVLLTGCSTVVEGAPLASTGVNGYLRVMSQEVPGSSSQAYLDIGSRVCDTLRSGKTREEVIFNKIDNGLSTENAILVVQSSIEHLCPEFS